MFSLGILTWRIIPNSKWLITMVSKSPKWGCGTPFKWPFHGLEMGAWMEKVRGTT